jgi:glyoxylase-like metal-dependent hydrolase (beta-lactamase superfamily II)
VNAYLLDTVRGPVMVDTGFASSWPVLRRSLEVAGVAKGELVAVLTTHAHADHLGAMDQLREEYLASEGEIVMTDLTASVGREAYVDRPGYRREEFSRHGMTEAELARWDRELLALARQAPWPEPTTVIQRRGGVRFADLRVRFLYTPGHSPDHSALHATWDDGRSALLIGDLSLGAGLPMVGVRDWISEDPLAALMDSWSLIGTLGVDLALPGHGRPVDDLAGLSRTVSAAYVADLTTFVRQHMGSVVTAGGIMEAADHPSFAQRQFAFYGARARLIHLARAGVLETVSVDPWEYVVRRDADDRLREWFAEHCD